MVYVAVAFDANKTITDIERKGLLKQSIPYFRESGANLKTLQNVAKLTCTGGADPLEFIERVDVAVGTPSDQAQVDVTKTIQKQTEDTGAAFAKIKDAGLFGPTTISEAVKAVPKSEWNAKLYDPDIIMQK